MVTLPNQLFLPVPCRGFCFVLQVSLPRVTGVPFLFRFRLFSSATPSLCMSNKAIPPSSSGEPHEHKTRQLSNKLQFRDSNYLCSSLPIRRFREVLHKSLLLQWTYCLAIQISTLNRRCGRAYQWDAVSRTLVPSHTNRN